ncbi:GtrA family protein [Plasticicumulans acidivorans]|uniref:Putative flippase GtrA n=1 Tax=Plasticicumulans acidivorans TaxID=886464 RepID=A0A317MR77_9GAMM|nr:GtrA family protein [Plasticicumulans acidivorans]PWV58717.1 putative flippase GtrA [Plasticicumulans acidivorans]
MYKPIKNSLKWLANPRLRLVRFLLVGTLNTGFSYSLYAFFLMLGIHYTIANFLALIIGILFSFKTQSTLVFSNSNNKLLGRFCVTWLIIYIINTLLIGILIHFGLSGYTAGALALPVTVCLSYLMQKHFVFKVTDRALASAPGTLGNNG